MEKRRSLKEVLVSDYTFNPASFKWIPKGGSILEYIGQTVAYIEYTKETDDTEWKTTGKAAYIQSIHDYEELTGTYEILFSVIGEDQEGIIRRERIIPEGFSYNQPDTDNWMHRFTPFSLHYEMIEREQFWNRLGILYNTIPGMTFDELKKFQAQEKVENKLGYFENIHAIINTDIDGGLGVGLIAFRVSEITEPKLLSKTWKMGLKDSKGNYIPLTFEKKDLQENSETGIIKGWTLNEELIGDMKIIKIADQSKAEVYNPMREETKEDPAQEG